MYGSNGRNGGQYFIVTNKGCRMTSGSTSFYVTEMIHASEAISVGSDRRIKDAIGYDMSRYKDFFMKLKPSFYQYKHGVSQRFHTGFIAQDVESALAQSGLSNKDFAGLTVTPVVDVMEDGIEDFRYGLRYEEFVSLNTYMIQGLYRKIEQLEKEIRKLNEGV